MPPKAVAPLPAPDLDPAHDPGFADAGHLKRGGLYLLLELFRVLLAQSRGIDDDRGDPPDDLRINCVNAPAFAPPFVLRHEPAASGEGYTLAGHLHPAIVLSGPALQRERLPCFWLTPTGAVLPAFGSFTGFASVVPAPEDRIFVVADQDVIRVG